MRLIPVLTPTIAPVAIRPVSTAPPVLLPTVIPSVPLTLLPTVLSISPVELIVEAHAGSISTTLLVFYVLAIVSVFSFLVIIVRYISSSRRG